MKNNYGHLNEQLMRTKMESMEYTLILCISLLFLSFYALFFFLLFFYIEKKNQRIHDGALNLLCCQLISRWYIIFGSLLFSFPYVSEWNEMKKWSRWEIFSVARTKQFGGTRRTLGTHTHTHSANQIKQNKTTHRKKPATWPDE